MKRIALLVTAAALLALVEGVSAQARPDFSGQWTSDPQPAAVGERGAQPEAGARGGRGAGRRGGPTGDMGSGWGSPVTITQTATRLTVEYAYFTRGDMQPPIRFVFQLDGAETKNSVMMGHGIQVQISTAEWQGDRLVIRIRHTFKHPDTGQPMTANVIRSLSLATPSQLVIETVREGVLGGPTTTTRTEYRKL